MKYKIAVNLNRIPDSYKVKEDFDKAKSYHAKHGIELEFTFKNVSLTGYKTYHQIKPLDRWLILGSHNLVTIDQATDANMVVFDQGEWATPKGSKFPLRPETPNGSCYIFNNKPFINICRFIQLDWIQIAHETMHSLVYTANIKGFAIQDVMDTYTENNNPDSLTGNFAQQWKLLQPYLNSTESKLSVTVTRIFQDNKETIGQLRTNDGLFGCDTLELAYKNNQSNISSIPKGTYICQWKKMQTTGVFHYEIMNVPNRSGIFIHPGNYYTDIKGCILLGSSPHDINNDKETDLSNSKIIIEAFEKKMNKKDFQLIIK